MRSSVLSLVAAVVLVCLASGVRGDECHSTGGQCLDTKTHTCLGPSGFQAGLCPGVDTVRCCHGANKPKLAFVAVTTGSSQCAKQGGTCMDSRGNHCAAGWKVGLCPGAAEVVCCPGTVAAPAAAQAVTHSNALPKFEQLVECYPQGKAEEVKARLGGAINADWVSNTCAIRMSHTLNCVGRTIPQMGGESIRSASKANYIFRVKQLFPFLKKLFGPGTTYKPGSGSRGVAVNKLAGKRGIIMFDTTGAWDDASGHFDLWDGKLMVEQSHADAATVQRYFSLAVSVTLWQF